MNTLAEDYEYCSSGCESGWTLYLEQSFVSSHENADFLGKSHKPNIFSKEEGDDEEEDMVSDASSGPPHDDFDNRHRVFSFDDSKKNGKKKKNKKNIKELHSSSHGNFQEKLSCIDLNDTASSSSFHFSMNNFDVTRNNNQASIEGFLDFSQGFSATHFQEKSAFQEPFHSLSGNHLASK